MILRVFFHIFHTILVIALAVTLPSCVASAATIVTHEATDVTATFATLNGEVTYFEDPPCDSASGLCDFGGVKPLFVAIPQMDPLELQFFDVSTGNPTSWQWNFGDGTTSIEQHPKHRYEKPGTYSVTFWIKNGFNSGVFSKFVLSSDVPEAISVVTNFVTGVSGTEATLNGAVIDIGSAPNAAVFFKYGTDPNLDVSVFVDAGTLSSAGVFSAPLSGLTPGITYYVQACAKTDTNEVCDGIIPFTSAAAVVFFKYGTDPNLNGYNSADAGTLLNPDVFSAPLSGLTAGIRYYFKACVTTSTGEYCDGILSFVYEPASVVTTPATSVTATGVTLNGEITALGEEASLDVFFKYGLDPTLTIHTPVDAGTFSSAGAFATDISGLTTGTYYFQACATTSTGEVVCGALLSFEIPPYLTPTSIPTPTETVTVTPTVTVTITFTDTGTVTPTETVIVTPKETGTVLPTSTVTVLPTETGTVTPTETVTVTPMETVTVLPTSTVTVSDSP
jgi:PKD repeat protein